MVTGIIPEFPVRVFPMQVQEIIADFHSEMHFPVAYLGACILSCTAACIGNSRVIHPWGTWRENCSLYMGIVGSPGAIKSPTMAAIFRPLKKMDYKQICEYNNAMEEFNKVDLANKGPRPQSRQRLISDATIESIAELLSHNPLGLTMYSDELDGWLSSFDRYHNKRGGEVSQWLSLNRGEDIVINRKGSERIISVANPFVNVIGSIQPGILSRSFSGVNRDNGLLSRFLFVLDPQENDPVIWGEEDMPTNVSQRWESFVNKLDEAAQEYIKTAKQIEHCFQPDGFEWIRTWHDAMEEAINSERDMTGREVFRKIQTYAFRFALLLHVLREVDGGNDSAPEIISLEDSKNASHLAHYFYQTNYLIYNSLGKESNSYDQQLDERWRQFLSMLGQVFTTEEAIRVAEELKIPKRSMYHFLKASKYTVNYSHGKYRKK